MAPTEAWRIAQTGDHHQRLALGAAKKEDSRDVTGYRVRVAGLHSLPETHAERIGRRVEASKPGLLRVHFGRWDPDVVAIQQEGNEA